MINEIMPCTIINNVWSGCIVQLVSFDVDPKIPYSYKLKIYNVCMWPYTLGWIWLGACAWHCHLMMMRPWFVQVETDPRIQSFYMCVHCQRAKFELQCVHVLRQASTLLHSDHIFAPQGLTCHNRIQCTTTLWEEKKYVPWYNWLVYMYMYADSSIFIKIAWNWRVKSASLLSTVSIGLGHEFIIIYLQLHGSLHPWPPHFKIADIFQKRGDFPRCSQKVLRIASAEVQLVNMAAATIASPIKLNGVHRTKLVSTLSGFEFSGTVTTVR